MWAILKMPATAIESPTFSEPVIDDGARALALDLHKRSGGLGRGDFRGRHANAVESGLHPLAEEVDAH